jgi:hypothetical protein
VDNFVDGRNLFALARRLLKYRAVISLGGQRFCSIGPLFHVKQRIYRPVDNSPLPVDISCGHRLWKTLYAQASTGLCGKLPLIHSHPVSRETGPAHLASAATEPSPRSCLPSYIDHVTVVAASPSASDGRAKSASGGCQGHGSAWRLHHCRSRWWLRSSLPHTRPPRSPDPPRACLDRCFLPPHSTPHPLLTGLQIPDARRGDGCGAPCGCSGLGTTRLEAGLRRLALALRVRLQASDDGPDRRQRPNGLRRRAALSPAMSALLTGSTVI